MAKKIRHLLHRRSLVGTNKEINIERGKLTVQNPKAPSSNDIEYGELAINYGDGHEGIFLKNSNNEVVQVNTLENIRYDGKIDKSVGKFLDDRFVNRSGDTMYGSFTIKGETPEDKPEFVYEGDKFTVKGKTTELSGTTLNVNYTNSNINGNTTINGKTTINGDLVVDSGNTINAQVQYVSKIKNKDLITPEKHGGIKEGVTVRDLEKKSLSELFDDILYEEKYPTITNPSCSISLKGTFTSNGIYEVGAPAPINESDSFNYSFNRGEAVVVGIKPNKKRAGEETSHSIVCGGALGSKPKIELGVMTYTLTVNYAQGEELLTSKGNHATVDSSNRTIENPLKAGSIQASCSIFGTYPYYCNGGNASTGSGEGDFPSSFSEIKLPLKKWSDDLVGAKFASEASTGTRLEFLFPSLKNVTKVEFFNTVSGKWELYGTNNYKISDAGNKTVQGVQVAYKKLTTTGALSGALQLRFTVNNVSRVLDYADDRMLDYNDEEIINEIGSPISTYESDIMVAASTGNRPSGVASFAVNFEPGGQAPLDARLLVKTKADLTNAATYSAKNYYNGMTVTVLDDEGKSGIYILKDMSKITDINSWVKVDADAAKVSAGSGISVTGKNVISAKIKPNGGELTNNLLKVDDGGLFVNEKTLDDRFVNVSGDTINGNITVEGKSSLNSDVTIKGNTNLNTLTASGATNLNSGLNVKGGANVSGNTKFENEVKMNEALIVSGSSRFGDNIVAEKNLTVTGTANVSGDVSLGKNLTVSGIANISGDTTLAKNLTVNGTSTIKGQTVVNNNLIVTGTTNISGDTTLAKNLTVNGKTTLTDVTVNTKITSKSFELSTGGTVSIYKGVSGVSINNDIISAKVKEGDTILKVDKNGLYVDKNQVISEAKNAKYDSKLPDELTTPSKHGGLKGGVSVKDLKEKTLSELFDDILFEELQPNVVAPSCSISLTGGFGNNGIYEVGQAAPTTTDKFTVSFNRGTCTVVGQPNKFRAGTETSRTIKIANGEITAKPKVELGQMTYTLTVNYGQGDTLVTSKGNTADVKPNPLTAGSVTSSCSIFGTYPYYCNGQNTSTENGDSSMPNSVKPGTKLPLVNWNTKLIGAKFASEASTGTRLEFLFPSLKNVTKVEFFNTVSGKWETFGSDKYAVSDAGNKTVQGVQVAYKKLTTTGALSGALQLRFTVDNASRALDYVDGEEFMTTEFMSEPISTFSSEVMAVASTGNRPSGVASFAVNFEPGGQAPLDARLLVKTKADLTNAATYSAKNYYNGMTVTVLDDGGKKGIYVLKDMNNITNINSWVKLDIYGIALNWDKAKSLIEIKHKDTNEVIASMNASDFVKDGMLKDVKLVVNPSGQPQGTYLEFTFNTDSAAKTIYVNVTTLIDIYVGKNGVEVKGKDISLKLQDLEDSKNFISIHETNGISFTPLRNYITNKTKLPSEYSVNYPTEATGFTKTTGGTAFSDAIKNIDTNVSKLVSEVLKNDTVVSNSIKEIKNSCGLDDQLKYKKKPNDSILSGATSLDSADTLLSAKIQEVDKFTKDNLPLSGGNGISISSKVISAKIRPDEPDTFENALKVNEKGLYIEPSKLSDKLFTSQLDDNLGTPEAHGALNQGTKIKDLKTKTWSQLFEMILFKEIQPTVASPSCSISLTGGFGNNGIYEVGQAAPTTTDKFTVSFNRGTCTVVGQPNKFRAGTETSRSITLDNNQALTTRPKVILGTNSYKVVLNYGQGDLLLTSYGNKASVVPNPLAAGSVTASCSLQGTYPYYCNGQNTSTENGDSSMPNSVKPNTKLPLVNWNTTLIGAKFASEASTGTRLEFLFPSLKNVTKVEFYNTVSGKWETFGSDKYAVSDAGNKDVQGVQVAYKKLTTTGALSGALQLRFTVNNVSRALDYVDGEEFMTTEFMSEPISTFSSEVMAVASTGNRPSGVASFAVNFEPGGQAPLDARLLVKTKADLIATATYSAKNYYNGMTVTVLDDGGKVGIYVLKDMNKITSSDYSGWVKLDSDAAKVSAGNGISVTGNNVINVKLNQDSSDLAVVETNGLSLSKTKTYIDNKTKLPSEYNVNYPTEATGFTKTTGGTAFSDAIKNVDTNVSKLVDEVLKNETVVSNSIVNLNLSCGFNENIGYVTKPNDSILSGATSLDSADLLLSSAIRGVTNKVGNYLPLSGGTLTGNLTVQGTINATGAVYSSDKRLKENVVSILDSDIESVKDIELKSYNFINDESKVQKFGVIAQDLEEKGLGNLVVEDKNGKKGVDYVSFLILKIAQLEKEIQELKNK